MIRNLKFMLLSMVRSTFSTAGIVDPGRFCARWAPCSHIDLQVDLLYTKHCHLGLGNAELCRFLMQIEVDIMVFYDIHGE